MLKLNPHTIAIVAIIGFAALVFGSGILYGLPQEFDADELLFVVHAAKMLADGTIDPRWYGIPASMLMYALAAIFALMGVIGVAIGALDSLGELGQLFLRDVTLFYAAGRTLTVFTTLLCMPVMWRIMQILEVDRRSAYLALLAFCLSPLIVRYASVIRGDMYQMLFNLVGLWFALRALDQKHFYRDMAIAGACVGFALSNKYPGVLGAVPVIGAAIILLVDKHISLKRAAIGLALAGVASVVATFITAPFLFLHFREVLVNLAAEGRPSHLGHTNQGMAFALNYYVMDVLPGAVSIIGAVLALAGLTWFAPKKALQRGALLVGALFLAYLLFIASLNLFWQRWAIPLVPLACIGIALALDRLMQLLRDRARLRLAISIAASILILAPLAHTTYFEATARAFNHDTRARSMKWIQANLPRGTPILLEAFSPALSSEEFDVRISSQGEIVRWTDRSGRVRVIANFGHHAEQWTGSAESFIAAARAAGVQYVATSEWPGLYARERNAYPRQHLFYETLARELRLVRAFNPTANEWGPPVMLYALDPPEAAQTQSEN
jgi:4-amino-4-deoxy-L-arabinose transferase-like glycosyltransferase